MTYKNMPVAAAILALAAAASGQTSYEITHLRVPEGALEVMATALNGHEHVVGFTKDGGNDARPFVRIDGTITILPSPEGFPGAAPTRISDTGVISGNVWTNGSCGHSEAPLWPTELPPVYPLRTIDPDDADFADLDPLMSLIGDARVVQLAEFTHGLGDSFDARIRVTKFLHQRMGFDIILFETPMLLSAEMNAALAGHAPLEEVVDLAMFPIWAHSEQMMELFRYIRASKQSDRPIDLFGVDAQFAYFAGEKDILIESVSRVLGCDLDPVAAELVEMFAGMLDRLDVAAPPVDAKQFLLDRVLMGDLMFLLEAPSTRLRSLTTTKERSWCLRVLQTVTYMLEQRALQSLAPPFRGDLAAYGEHPAVHAAQNRRDQAMAANTAWIARKYLPGRKIVLWIANSHAQERVGPLFPGKDGLASVRQHTTGSYLADMMGDLGLFTLLHSFNTATAGGNFTQTPDGGYVWSEHTFGPAKADTLEARLHRAGLRHGIVDLSVVRGSSPHLRLVLDNTDLKPLQMYGDALLYIDHDGPSRPRARPEGSEDEGAWP